MELLTILQEMQKHIDTVITGLNRIIGARQLLEQISGPWACAACGMVEILDKYSQSQSVEWVQTMAERGRAALQWVEWAIGCATTAREDLTRLKIFVQATSEVLEKVPSGFHGWPAHICSQVGGATQTWAVVILAGIVIAALGCFMFSRIRSDRHV